MTFTLSMNAADPAPVPRTSRHSASKSLKRGIVSVIPILLTPLGAHAGLFTSPEQDAVTEIGNYQRPINEVIDQLKPAYVPNGKNER